MNKIRKYLIHLLGGVTEEYCAEKLTTSSLTNTLSRSFYKYRGLKMIIKIEDGIDDLTAITLVKQVIEQGKISANGNSYCYLTLFGDAFVETRQNRKSPCFRVYKQKIYDNK